MSIPLEAANSGSLSHTYSGHKPPREVLVEIGIPHESKPGNQLTSRDDLGYRELFSSCCAELGVPLDLGRCSKGISGVA